MNYKEARVYLDEVSKYGSVLGLDNMRELLMRLGNPQDDLKFIHISGTNGKGSALSYMSTILSGAGLRTGRYSPPTLCLPGTDPGGRGNDRQGISGCPGDHCKRGSGCHGGRE